MSRGFVKEEDQEEAPFIPPRAALPDGVPNYMTPRGLQLLLDERTALESERAAVVGSDDERRRTQAVIDGRLALLNERIVTARLVEPAADHDEVRFGSTVTFTHEAGQMAGTTLTFTIVGVDEADVKQGRIAFTAPLARALMGRRTGDVAPLQLGAEGQRLRVEHIE
jgi:transcription elongation factor GreB